MSILRRYAIGPKPQNIRSWFCEKTCNGY